MLVYIILILTFNCDSHQVQNGYCTKCDLLKCDYAECLDDYLWNGETCTIGPPPPPMPPQYIVQKK